MQNKPSYAVDSVDHALLLAQLLQQEGTLRVTDAADRLGVSRSTAHRLLAMLVYRDFAEQQDDRRYRAGRMLGPAETSAAPVGTLRTVCLPHLHALSARVRETTNLMVRVATAVRFTGTMEAEQPVRVGDRVGREFPAHLASGGQALLASLSPQQLAELYAHQPDVDLTRLRRTLGQVRTRGFAINDQHTETGLTAVGMAFGDASGEVCAALSIALPSARFDCDQLPAYAAALSDTAISIRHDLDFETATPHH